MPRSSLRQALSSRPVAAAVLGGGVAALLWVAARRYGRERADQIFDWDQATALALRACRSSPALAEDDRTRAAEEYAAILAEVAAPLAAYTSTGLDLAQREIRVLDRGGWVLANVASFRDLLHPFEELYRSTTAESAFDLPGLTAVGRTALSAQVGLLLGYLARRVLGQYDISLLGGRPAEPGTLYFVEPNVRSVQWQLGLPHREFRTWLTLHEATHACELEGYPWVRDYLNRTVQAYLETMLEEIRAGDGSLRSFIGRTVQGTAGGVSLIESMMTPQQREIFSRLQALMCLLEGYASHVMNALGEGLLPHFREIEHRVEERSSRRGIPEQLFLRLTGLQLKFDQYRLGTAFVDRVKRERGMAFMNRVWDGAERLPMETEIAYPDRWIQRMDQTAA